MSGLLTVRGPDDQANGMVADASSGTKARRIPGTRAAASTKPRLRIR